MTINSVILEPVPLYTKANDGVRPFVEVHSGSKMVATSFKDYGNLKLYTPYDVEVILNTSLKASGDLTVVVYHGRQSLGTFFAGKLEKIRICQVSFNPAAVSTTKNHVRFPTHELDCIGDVEKIPADFSVTVNFTRSAAGPVKKTFPYKMPEKRKLDLIYGSKAEFNDAVQLVTGDSPPASSSSMPTQETMEAPERPPRGDKKNHSPLLDLGGGGVAAGSTTSPANPLPPKDDILLDFGGANSMTKNTTPATTTANANTLEEELFGGGEDREQLLDIGFDSVEGEQLLDIGFDSCIADPASRQPSPGLFRGDSIFGIPSGHGPSSAAEPPIDDDLFNIRANPPPPAGNTPTIDLFGMAPSSSQDLFQQPMAPSAQAPTTKPSDNLLGDLLSPQQTATTNKSASEQMVEDMLSQLNVNKAAENSASAKASEPSLPSQSSGNRPNYSSSFFQEPKKPGGVGVAPMTKPPSSATFDDLLASNGFTSSREKENRYKIRC